ncbi:MAG: DUF5009 domain-containing protein [Sediminibacterium sp.]|nr:DUF5009 domain-containing protein [Sediminibacterium sp.]
MPTIDKAVPSATNKNRLYSLDALRGFDMFWIMGAEEIMHAWYKASGSPLAATMSNQFTHPDWHGFTAYDLIFPLFLFLAGVATPFSVGRELANGKSKSNQLLRVFKRSMILVLLGIFYNNGLEALQPFQDIRFASVLGRIGLAYLFANIIYLYFKQQFILIWFAAILIVYWLILNFTAAPGFLPGNFSMEGNTASYIDRLILPGKLYKEIHDPEGLFSTIPAISTGLLGIATGNLLKLGEQTKKQKAIYMAVAGFVFLIVAQLWNLIFPINKNLWTSSFVMQTGGCSLLLLSIFYYIIDVLGYTKWAFFFRVIGMNSILIYISERIIDWHFSTKALFGWLIEWVGEPYHIVVLAFGFVAIKWLFLYFMYKQKVFLKV